MPAIEISADGRVSFLWDDALADLTGEGATVIRRASHVEPAPGGGWTADLSPSGGPVLGPFPYRGDALDAERQWLEDNRLPGGACEGPRRRGPSAGRPRPAVLHEASMIGHGPIGANG